MDRRASAPISSRMRGDGGPPASITASVLCMTMNRIVGLLSRATNEATDDRPPAAQISRPRRLPSGRPGWTGLSGLYHHPRDVDENPMERGPEVGPVPVPVPVLVLVPCHARAGSA